MSLETGACAQSYFSVIFYGMPQESGVCLEQDNQQELIA